MGNRLAVHDTTMSNSASRDGRSASGSVEAARAAAQVFGAGAAAVGDGQGARLAGREMGGCQLDHFAGADEEHAGFAQVFEELRGQAHRGRGHADGVAADLGRGAHFLGHRERALEHLLQRAAQGAGGIGLAHRLLELAEDLRLAEHHRVEPAGDPEGMAGRRRPFEHVGMRTQGVARHAAHAGQPVDGRLHGLSVGTHVDLGTIAGGDDGDLVDTLQPRAKTLQRLDQLLRREREPAAQIERRGRVVEPQGEDAHRTIIKLSQGAATACCVLRLALGCGAEAGPDRKA